MNPGPLVFLATFFLMAVSWVGFVLGPQLQVGRQPDVVLDTGQLYPPMRPGDARQGEQVYRANGCASCHTQQVRPEGYGSDVERGWGARPGVVQNVAEDYLYDRPAMLGSQRVGPDLANYGKRQTNEMTILLRLYDPQNVMGKTVMPPYRYLFTPLHLQAWQQRPDDALPPGGSIGKDDVIVPTPEAHALAAYLMSLRSDAVLFETPPPAPPPTNKPAVGTALAGTNAPTATNAPAATNASTAK